MRRAQRRKFHFIYKTTCLITGRYYVGMHSTDNMDDGYLGSGKQLWNSIRKHGRDHHRCEVIEMCEHREALQKREEELVDDALLEDEMCMNISKGGKGGWDFVNEHSLSPRGSTGGRRKAAKKLLEWRIRTKAASGFKDKHHTHERNARVGKIMSKAMMGAGNPAFGKKWIHKAIERKRVLPDEIQSYVDSGWTLGKKIKR